MKKSPFVRSWVALVLGVALCVPGAVGASEERSRAVKVERRVFPVTLEDGSTWPLVGYLYYQGSLENRPVQILTHGITYTHTYWDAPSVGGRRYSYAEFMARRRYAVLALDMLGTGESGRPAGDELGLWDSASALHQVTEQLRKSGRHGTFQTIIYVGHSNGALISTVAQGVYHGADALVNTGWLNTFHELPVEDEVIDPLLEHPYVSIPPELRSALFYDKENADLEVIAYDNAWLADTFSRGQFEDLLDVLEQPCQVPTEEIRVPVLVQLGDNDVLAPAAYAEQEAARYPAAESVTVQTFTGMGHAANLHYGAREMWERVDAWLRTWFHVP
ncbi:MAG TPA: alpha/beta fold hydrolase [Myxococcaceae bacterium]|nr:alpha/beta fold hydrolase [Myxococcaceae bacterium]